MRHHHTGSRPHVQGSRRPLRVRHSAQNLTDGGGLVLVRKLFDRFGLAGWIDGRANKEKGSYRPGLMIEVWIALLLYGGGVIDDLPLLERRGVRRIFGWIRVPDPTTFGRWLRRASERMVPLLDELLWRMVRQRWALRARGVPKKLTLTLDSTVVVRYGHKQAGAELGYNPKKRGRRSHHPLVAFVNETGDCLGVRWRAGNAHTAEGATEWLQALVGRLTSAGVGDITVRLDKGFFSQKIVRALEELGVSFLLKVPRHRWLDGHRGPWRYSKKGDAIFAGEKLWSATGSLWDARLLTIQTRKPVETEEGMLELDTYEVGHQADVLTNIPGIHALTAWRRYNGGAVVEQRIEELAQLSAGKTAVDDLGGNALLWSLAVVGYQTLHTLRQHFLSGSWRTAQPKRLRLWLLRLPAKLTTHGRKSYLQLLRDEPVRLRLLTALRGLNHDIPPPVPA